MSSASKWPRLTDVPAPLGSNATQEDDDSDPEPESYGYDDDDDEEEEEETNMIPGSRDRGTPPQLRAQLPALHRAFLQRIPPIPEGKAEQDANIQVGSPASHTLALPSGCNLVHPEPMPRSAPLNPAPISMTLSPEPHLT